MLVVLLTMLLMYQVDAAIVNVATPAIRVDLGASGAQLELVIAGYLLASAATLITGARLGHMYGYRRVFLIGVGVFGVASLACGLATSPVALIAARLVQGLGGALAYPQVLTGIQLGFAEGAERTRALGLYSLALAGGAVIGQIAGGVLVSADVLGLSWRPVFLVNVPVAVAVVLAGLRLLPPQDTPAATRRLDLPGAAVLASAVLAILLPLTLGRDSGWPPWAWICLAASLPLAGAFLAIERRQAARGRSPLVDLRVIRRPAIAWGLWPQALTVATYYALLFTLALYLQRGLGRSAEASGLTLLPWVMAFAVPGRLLGRLPARAHRTLPALGCLLMAVAYTALSLILIAGRPPEAALLVPLAIGGLGLGTVFSSLLVHVTAAATPRYAADISGVFTTTMQIAGAIGLAGFGALYLSQAPSGGADGAGDAFALVTAAFALVALVAGAAAHRATRVGATSRAGTGP
jgi:MFS family permease